MNDWLAIKAYLLCLNIIYTLLAYLMNKQSFKTRLSSNQSSKTYNQINFAIFNAVMLQHLKISCNSINYSQLWEGFQAWTLLQAGKSIHYSRKKEGIKTDSQIFFQSAVISLRGRGEKAAEILDFSLQFSNVKSEDYYRAAFNIRRLLVTSSQLRNPSTSFLPTPIMLFISLHKKISLKILRNAGNRSQWFDNHAGHAYTLQSRKVDSIMKAEPGWKPPEPRKNIFFLLITLLYLFRDITIEQNLKNKSLFFDWIFKMSKLFTFFCQLKSSDSARTKVDSYFQISSKFNKAHQLSLNEQIIRGSPGDSSKLERKRDPAVRGGNPGAGKGRTAPPRRGHQGGSRSQQAERVVQDAGRAGFREGRDGLAFRPSLPLEALHAHLLRLPLRPHRGPVLDLRRRPQAHREGAPLRAGESLLQRLQEPRHGLHRGRKGRAHHRPRSAPRDRG